MSIRTLARRTFFVLALVAVMSVSIVSPVRADDGSGCVRPPIEQEYGDRQRG
jgi:hypothetical protein